MREFLDRAQAAVADDGRLPLGGMPGWDVFPFERDGLRARPLTEYADPEPDRRKTPADCKTCAALDRADLVLHTGERLGVIRPGGTNLPFVANIVSRSHEPLDDLDDDGHVELGRLIGRTYAALRALDGIGNVHVNKWEKGTGHLSVTLPPTPAQELDARADQVRAALAAL